VSGPAPDNCGSNYVSNGGLVRDGTGNFYFTLSGQDSGACNAGRVFKWTPPSTVTPFYDLGCPTATHLAGAGYGVSVGNDGALYGAASGGGANDVGGIYRVAADGTGSTVGSFPSSFMVNAQASRIMNPPAHGTDGRFYGMQMDQVSDLPNRTFVYRLDPTTGTASILYDFPASGGGISYPDGHLIRGRLVEVPPLPGNDIAWMGTTAMGGTYSAGLVFRIDVAGNRPTFSKVYEFNSTTTYLGETSVAGLVRDVDGTLYGTTFGYGAPETGVNIGPGAPPSGEFGTVFRIGTDGAVSKLYGDPFIRPFGPILIGNDGNLYGTSYVNSGAPTLAESLGSVFRIRLIPAMKRASGQITSQ
jgi:uncharacterized repeat protein (TIGR03803 family)